MSSRLTVRKSSFYLLFVNITTVFAFLKFCFRCRKKCLQYLLQIYIKKFQDLYLDNKIKKVIFEKRMYCEKENEIKLKDLSKLLNISIQRISLIEKNLKNQFKKYFNIEKNKIEDIK